MPRNRTTDPDSDDDDDEGRIDDDTPVDRYRDSPGAALLTDDDEPAEPNEPG